MTPGRINQVTAFHSDHECRLTPAEHLVAQDMAHALHVLMVLRLSQHGGWTSHRASHSHLQSLHASILLCLVGQLVCVKPHTHPATAVTSTSLGSLADPGGSRTGCIQLFSQRYREITGATLLGYTGDEPIDACCHGTGTVSATSLVWTEAC